MSQQRPLSPADPSHLAEMRRREKDAARDFAALMDDVRFRRFVWSFLGEAGVFQDRFSENSNKHAREAGKRAMGLWVMQKIDAHCPERYAQMVRENQPQPVIDNEVSDD